MSYLKIVTNAVLGAGGPAALALGDSDAPAAFAELKSICLPVADCARLSQDLCAR